MKNLNKQLTEAQREDFMFYFSCSIERGLNKISAMKAALNEVFIQAGFIEKPKQKFDYKNSESFIQSNHEYNKNRLAY